MIRLRAARAGDVAALLALERRCFRHDRLDARDFARALADPRALLRVAVQDGVVSAYALARLDPVRHRARLDSLAVAPAARGRGLGVRLTRSVERLARRAGAARLRLEVRLSNRAARALYARLGYQPVARLPGYYADGAHALRFEKAFAARRGRAL
jgi:ribosomal-protein-alanine N-acetyltransferase